MRVTNFGSGLGATAVLALALALSLAVSGCGGGGNGGGGGGLIAVSGRVLDDGSLEAVAGARVVAATGEQTTTDATGLFNLAGLASNVGSLTITMAGYNAVTVTVAAGAGDQSVGTVYLPPSLLAGNGRITGTVTTAGSPTAGAVVTAAGKTATTRANGVFTLYNVPAGTQTVQARSSDGLTGGSATTTVTAGATVTVSIALTTQPPPPPPI